MQRWARAFRDDEYHATVNTNNGVEALNRVLKYSFLPRQKKAISQSGLITVLVEAFLPEIYEKYLFLSYEQSTSYRDKDFVPTKTLFLNICMDDHGPPYFTASTEKPTAPSTWHLMLK